jgi:transposase
MQLQSILRRIHKHPGFVYDRVEWAGRGTEAFHIHVRPRAGAKAICAKCETKRPGYDTLAERLFAFVPLWGIAVYLVYAMRRVDCPTCGVTVEKVPWAQGKQRTTLVYAQFLAGWAKVLSWQEVARRFHTSWDTVFRSVEAIVTWGLAHRCLDGIRAIGVDELAWKAHHKYLTLVYQLDNGCKRLLWIGQDRTKASFHRFFDLLDADGKHRSQQIEFIISDMWKAFLGVIAKRASAAVHILDRFHVEQLLHKALDTVRRQEVRALRAKGKEAVLTKTRWILLKRKRNLTRAQAGRLRELVRINLKSVRAYLLKEQFRRFWSYKSAHWAGRFLDSWTRMAMRSRIEPLKSFAKTLRTHRSLLLNWFRARGVFSQGAVEGFNNKARVTTRKAYGFRSYRHAEIALYHALGDLPEPPCTHRFC